MERVLDALLLHLGLDRGAPVDMGDAAGRTGMNTLPIGAARIGSLIRKWCMRLFEQQQVGVEPL